MDAVQKAIAEIYQHSEQQHALPPEKRGAPTQLVKQFILFLSSFCKQELDKTFPTLPNPLPPQPFATLCRNGTHSSQEDGEKEYTAWCLYHRVVVCHYLMSFCVQAVNSLPADVIVLTRSLLDRSLGQILSKTATYCNNHYHCYSTSAETDIIAKTFLLYLGQPNSIKINNGGAIEFRALNPTLVPLIITPNHTIPITIPYRVVNKTMPSIHGTPEAWIHYYLTKDNHGAILPIWRSQTTLSETFDLSNHYQQTTNLQNDAKITMTSHFCDSDNLLSLVSNTTLMVKMQRRSEALMLAMGLPPNDLLTLLGQGEQDQSNDNDNQELAATFLQQLAILMKPDVDVVMDLITELALGLDYMHNALSVAHFDIKPDNIFVSAISSSFPQPPPPQPPPQQLPPQQPPPQQPPPQQPTPTTTTTAYKSYLADFGFSEFISPIGLKPNLYPPHTPHYDDYQRKINNNASIYHSYPIINLLGATYTQLTNNGYIDEAFISSQSLFAALNDGTQQQQSQTKVLDPSPSSLQSPKPLLPNLINLEHFKHFISVYNNNYNFSAANNNGINFLPLNPWHFLDSVWLYHNWDPGSGTDTKSLKCIQIYGNDQQVANSGVINSGSGDWAAAGSDHQHAGDNQSPQQQWLETTLDLIANQLHSQLTINTPNNDDEMAMSDRETCSKSTQPLALSSSPLQSTPATPETADDLVDEITSHLNRHVFIAFKQSATRIIPPLPSLTAMSNPSPPRPITVPFPISYFPHITQPLSNLLHFDLPSVPKGTGPYMAPEVWLRYRKYLSGPYDPFSSDVYSFGLCCCILVLGVHPYLNQAGFNEQIYHAYMAKPFMDNHGPSPNVVFDMLSQQHRINPKLWILFEMINLFYPELIDLITAMIQPRVQDRATIRQVVLNPDIQRHAARMLTREGQ